MLYSAQHSLCLPRTHSGWNDQSRWKKIKSVKLKTLTVSAKQGSESYGSYANCEFNYLVLMVIIDCESGGLALRYLAFLIIFQSWMLVLQGPNF